MNGGGSLQVRQHHPGLHPRGTGDRVELEDAAQVTAEVEDQAGPDGVAGDRGAGAAGGHRHPELAGRARVAAATSAAEAGKATACGTTRYSEASAE